MIQICPNWFFVFNVIFIQSVVKGLFSTKRERKTVITPHLNFKVEISANESQHVEKYQPIKQPEISRRSVTPNKAGPPGHTLKNNCSNQCTGRKTVFKNELACYYDNACFETFYDCCDDYERCCGKQIKRFEIDTTPWKCVKTPFKKIIPQGAFGLWMMQKCPIDYSSHETKHKCHNPPANISLPVENSIPVVGKNGITYRNKYCAICDGIKNYSSWNINVTTFVTPPAEYNLEDKLKFIVNTDGEFWYEPRRDQPRRYCVENVIGECADNSHRAYNACVNGPVERVFSGGKYFKNEACAECRAPIGSSSSIAYSYEVMIPSLYIPISRVVKLDKPVFRLKQSNGTRNKFFNAMRLPQNFTIEYENITFWVIKAVSKQLACVGQKTISTKDYKINKDNGTIIEHNTGRTSFLKYMSMINETEGNITLCRQLVFADCNNGTYVELSSQEYVILSDLTLYHKSTNHTYPFGEYYVKDLNHDVADDLNSSRNNDFASSLRNSTVIICRSSAPNDEIKRIFRAHNFSLWILTMIGFGISILSVLLVLLTYTLFSELRTLPGKNLMNFCLSLFIFESLWLIVPALNRNTVSCTTFAILEHYFILVSFVAMSVISHHSCVVFSKKSVIARRSETEKRRTFLKYSAVVWASPAAFVALCIVLDKTEKFPINYGTACWLGTKNAKIFLFLLPIGISLLFNILAFLRTSIFLSQHKRHIGVFKQTKVQNLKICIKLSTLTGLPWIFGFLSAAFGNVVMFEYLFVIFVCSQGFYIAVAFLWNTKVLKLYKDLLNNGNQNNDSNESARLTKQEAITAV